MVFGSFVHRRRRAIGTVLPLCVAILLSPPHLLATDDVADGDIRDYVKTYSDGSVRIEGEQIFHDGRWHTHGDFKIFNSDGTVKESGRYEFGNRLGLWTNYYDGHNIYDETPYHVFEGKSYRHGQVKRYLMGNRLDSTIEYDHGQRHGQQLHYFGRSHNGAPVVQEVTPWVRGKKQGPMVAYHSPPNHMTIRLKGQYHQGKKYGKWVYYQLDGSIYQTRHLGPKPIDEPKSEDADAEVGNPNPMSTMAKDAAIVATAKKLGVSPTVIAAIKRTNTSTKTLKQYHDHMKGLKDGEQDQSGNVTGFNSTLANLARSYIELAEDMHDAALADEFVPYLHTVSIHQIREDKDNAVQRMRANATELRKAIDRSEEQLLKLRSMKADVRKTREIHTELVKFYEDSLESPIGNLPGFRQIFIQDWYEMRNSVSRSLGGLDGDVNRQIKKLERETAKARRAADNLEANLDVFFSTPKTETETNPFTTRSP